MTRARGLGRGLGALIPPATAGVDEIDIDLIVPNPHQPRIALDEDSLAGLVESVKEHGIIQPLLVTASSAEGVYQLVAGERRLRAARQAGLARVPVVIKDVANRELLELALVENLQREDLNVLEQAQAFRRLSEEFGITQEQISARVGKSRTAISNAMRLLALSDEIKASLVSGGISEGHGRALLGIEDEAVRRHAWQQVIERGLTVRQTEKLARRATTAGGVETSARQLATDPEIAALEERLRATVGTKVDLRRRKNGRGRLVLHFYSDEELEGLLTRLGVGTEG